VPDHRSGTVTFVFTDIEGSTRLARALRERWPEVRSDQRRLVRAAFAAHGGEEVDTQGDSFFYVFPRARDAAVAAAEAQRALAAHDWPEDGEVRIRVGMHTGEPVVSDEGYHGIGVHRAARIMAAGHGGQVLMSEATAAVLADEEVSGVAVRDLGRHQLKDLDRGEHVFQLVAEGLGREFPRIRTATPPRPFYRRPLVIGAAAGVLAAAVAIPVFALAGGSGGGSALERVDDNAVGVLDVSSRKPIAQATGIESPQDVAAGAGAVWVSSSSGNVVKLDPQTHKVEETIEVGDGPRGLAVSGRDLWVANSLDGTVSRVSTETNREVQKYAVGNTPSGVTVGAGSVWVTNAGDGTISRLDAANGAVKQLIDAEGPVRDIAFGGGSVWVSDPVGNQVVQVPVDASSPTQRINVGSGPTAIGYGGGLVWVSNSLDGTVSRIDPASGVPTTYPVGASPNGVAVGPDAAWVSDEVDGTVVRVDPKTGAASPSTLGGRPEGVAVSGASVWVAVQAAGSAHRGGHLRLLSGIIDFVDPAFSYYAPIWQILSVTSDGLVGFKRVGGIEGNTIVPDLATRLPQPADGGRTYAFQLRRGIRFSNGSELDPGDVRFTFERLFRAFAVDANRTRMRSPRLDFFAGIVGARACHPQPDQPPPKTCDLSRGIVTNDADSTVTFHLEAPDADFLYKLALPFAAIVPEGTAVGRDRPTPGSGPYRISEYQLRRRAHLERNPYFRVWSRAAQPEGAPDTIDLDTNLSGGKRPPETGTEAFRAVSTGRADWSTDFPLAALETARTRYPAQLHVTPQAFTSVVHLNPKRRPFSSTLARRAVAFALDRGRMVAAAGGSDFAAPTCQVLPPNSPGYRRFCPYTERPQGGVWSAPDLQKARQAVARSGTCGARVRMIMGGTADFAPGEREVAAALRRLGYRVSVKRYPRKEYFNAFFTQSEQIDVALNGWYQDYPAPSNFFTGLLGCGNSPYTCDPALDRRMARLALEASASGSNRGWTAFDRMVVREARVVPVTNLKAIDFVSKRLGNYQRHPVFGLLIDQVWVR
jgi:ABC-type transport system substrate-binding protein/class 3 adenylate cyclase/streptogramin lyase